MANTLEERIRQHPKKELIQIVRRDWTKLARSGKLKFSDDTLVVAFIDPTGISQVPMNAMLQLTKNKRIDLLVTIQHSLGITRNLSQYLKSEPGRTAMDRFLASDEWRGWKWKDPSEFARLAIDAFGKRIKREGFIGTRHISIPEHHPLYRFTLFSRHDRTENFWNKILKIDESGQRELL